MYTLLWAAKFVSTKNEIKIIWLHICPVLDCLLLYDRTGRWNHMIIAGVKVFLLFLIVDIISNCQTIIIDNYTKNRGNFFEWNEYNFDDTNCIDKLMLKRKADDEFKIIVLKKRMFSKMVRALHSCNTTEWASRSVQWESHQHKTITLSSSRFKNSWKS
jgi:hypothetical protein